LASKNNKQELLTHFSNSQNNTLNQLENNTHGNTTQLQQANHHARHLYAQLLRNPDISGWSLATDPAYDRLTTFIYQTEPLEIIASAKGLRQGTTSFENNFAEAAAHPLDTLSNIGTSLEQTLQNPKQTLTNFAFGNMLERERLADIMEMDNPQQRMQAATAYYTEFYLNRATAMAGTMAGSKLIANTGKFSLAYAAETAKKMGEDFTFTGMAPVTEGAPLSAASQAGSVINIGSKNAPWAIGAMSMNNVDHEPTPRWPTSDKVLATAQLAKEEYVLVSRLLNGLKRIANADNVSASDIAITDTLTPMLTNVLNDTRVKSLQGTFIPEGQIMENLQQLSTQVLKDDFQISKAAEDSVIQKVLAQTDAGASNLSAEFQQVAEANNSSPHALAEGTLRYQIFKIQYENELIPAAQAAEPARIANDADLTP